MWRRSSIECADVRIFSHFSWCIAPIQFPCTEAIYIISFSTRLLSLTKNAHLADDVRLTNRHYLCVCVCECEKFAARKHTKPIQVYGKSIFTFSQLVIRNSCPIPTHFYCILPIFIVRVLNRICWHPLAICIEQIHKKKQTRKTQNFFHSSSVPMPDASARAFIQPKINLCCFSLNEFPKLDSIFLVSECCQKCVCVRCVQQPKNNNKKSVNEIEEEWQR